ncbi:MAG: LrgB family protein [Marinilabiliaceae bacterium]|nr:LrgB family protein [Marinilabiliaceae bacterium]
MVNSFSFAESEAFLLLLTIGAYYVGVVINRKVRKPFTNPLLIAICLLIPVLTSLGIDYEHYEKGSHAISLLLSPTVVALGYTLHCQIKYIKGNVTRILLAITAGSIVGVLSVVAICLALNTPHLLMVSMEPKSVTMPIALGITSRTGGLLPLTAISVFICGIFGSIIGPWFLRKIGIKSPLAVGLAMGSASHGVGTSRALQIGQLEGAVAGMAIGLMGVWTAVVIPLVEQIIK